MKITDLENEEALDLLADLIDPAASIFADQKIKEIINSGQPRIILVKYIIKIHKPEIIQILARLNGVEVKDYHGNVVTMIKDLLDIMNDPALADFFTSQEQKMDEN